MAITPCLATIRASGNILRVNVRTEPSATAGILQTLDNGTASLPVLGSQPDQYGAGTAERTYHWLRIELPNGNTGWVRDDLVALVGDCADAGYRLLATPTQADQAMQASGTVSDDTVAAPPFAPIDLPPVQDDEPYADPSRAATRYTEAVDAVIELEDTADEDTDEARQPWSSRDYEQDALDQHGEAVPTEADFAAGFHEPETLGEPPGAAVVEPPRPLEVAAFAVDDAYDEIDAASFDDAAAYGEHDFAASIGAPVEAAVWEDEQPDAGTLVVAETDADEPDRSEVVRMPDPFAAITGTETLAVSEAGPADDALAAAAPVSLYDANEPLQVTEADVAAGFHEPEALDEAPGAQAVTEPDTSVLAEAAYDSAWETDEPSAADALAASGLPVEALERAPIDDAEAFTPPAALAFSSTTALRDTGTAYSMADRIRLAAFNITAGFESIGYASFQAEDSGIVSYGRFQTTLASGNLEQVLQLYLSRAAGHFADVLREQYIPRVRARDASLRFDTGFRDLLLRLARDPAMQQAQNDQATRSLWGLVRSYSINPRGVSTALGQALLFDMSVNHGAAGSERYYLQEVERVLRVRPKSMLGANGVDERDFIRRVAEFRRDRLYVIAAQRGWGGLRPRGDFWVDRVWADDWDLQGDADGAVQVKEGVRVRVRQP